MGKRKLKKEESDDDAYEYGVPAAAKPARKRRAPAKSKAKKEEPDAGIPLPAAVTTSTSFISAGVVGAEQMPIVAGTFATVAGTSALAIPADLVNEKRQARYRKSMPKNIEERLARVRSQRFYMIGRERNGTDLKESFKVLGSTGNVYTVTIQHVPTCDCPDYARKGNHCKHLLFIMLKVLNVPSNSGNLYQKAYLTSELEEVFRNAPVAPANNVYNHRITKAWQTATGGPAQASTSANDPKVPTGKRKIIDKDDTCPICYEDIFGVDQSQFVFCEESCGGPIHKDCFSNWSANCRGTGKKVTCVYCRADWPVGSGGEARAPGQPSYDGNYLNLADVVGIDRERDRSTYYYGPRTGVKAKTAYWEAVERYGGHPGRYY